AHGRMTQRRWIRTARAALRVWELVAQAGDAERGETCGDRAHERVLHVGAGTVREEIAGARSRGLLEACRDRLPCGHREGDEPADRRTRSRHAVCRSRVVPGREFT